MKRLLLLLTVLFVGLNASAAQKYELPNGQSVAVRITSDVTSKSKSQQTVTAIVERDVYDLKHEKVLIRRGTPITLATQIQRAKGMGKAGYININCLSTTAVDGQTIYLLGGLNVEGDDKKGAALGCGLGLGLTVLFPVGFFCFCIQGENVSVPANTMINNVVVNERYFVVAE
ncbi:MAG: hypothetical protein IJ348_03930 [Alistipes sp.]|nr:hypothetical protein [Alistipes sp.]